MSPARTAKRPSRTPVQRSTPEAQMESEAPPEIDMVHVGFDGLGLSDPIRAAVTDAGYETPTPIQARAIPVLLSGRDMIGQAQTGTGKTAAFALPIIQMLDPASAVTQAIILAPTRELAIQVAGEFHTFARSSGLHVVPVYGGQPIDRQFRALRSAAHIVVGTPGRVMDHLRRGSLSLADVKTCVLDEADEMLALGFLEDIETILADLPEVRQIALFSATMPARIATVARKFLHAPVRIAIESKRRTLETTNQTYYDVPRGKKLDALTRVLDMETPGPTIVFCRTRKETAELADSLMLRGYSADALHGEMAQPERDRVMRRFREGQADLLIATDVAARGLDIDTVTHVINYDIPWDVEQYIHRIGRTGRAGRDGDAITLVEPNERRQLRAIEIMIGSRLKPARIPTSADISARRHDKMTETLRERLAKGDFERHLATVSELAEEYDPSEVAAAALQMVWESLAGAPKDPQAEIASYGEQPEQGMARVLLEMGRKHGLRPGDVVGAIANEAGISGKNIGVIEILDETTFVEVPAAAAADVVAALSRTRLKGKRIKVHLVRRNTPEQA